jgi:hypothetical protein
MGPLSLYLFEAHGSYLHARHERVDRAVPVLGSSGLLAQIGCGVKECDTRKARATIRHWHAIVKSLWPGCPNELVRDETILMVRGGFAIQHGRLSEPRAFGVRPLDQLSLERMRESPRRPAVERERVLAQD